MQETQQKLETLLLNKPLTHIEFYNVGEKYFELKPEHSWLFNGGVELHFGEEVFALAWDMGNDSFDYTVADGVKPLLKDADYQAVEATSISNVSQLIGKSIQNIEFDENGELKEEKVYVPMGLKITFSNDSTLQIATVEALIHPETLDVVEAYYNLIGQLLISVNNEFKIERQDIDFPTEH
jgi:hypothetical protein